MRYDRRRLAHVADVLRQSQAYARSELVIQYGYATLFSSAFKLAPLLSFLINWVEFRIDSFKMLEIL